MYFSIVSVLWNSGTKCIEKTRAFKFCLEIKAIKNQTKIANTICSVMYVDVFLQV